MNCETRATLAGEMIVDVSSFRRFKRAVSFFSCLMAITGGHSGYGGEKNLGLISELQTAWPQEFFVWLFFAHSNVTFSQNFRPHCGKGNSPAEISRVTKCVKMK